MCFLCPTVTIYPGFPKSYIHDHSMKYYGDTMTTIETLKRCNKCRIVKPLEDFHKDNRYNRKSHRARCIECEKVDKKEDYAKNGRKYKLSTQYGLSENDYQDILEKQGNQCAICGIDADEY